MPSLLPTPPSGVPLFNPITQSVDILWQNYFNALSQISGGFAPLDARYWVSTSNSDLTNETNLGSLTTGYLKLTSAAGVGTPSTVMTIPGSDITGAALTKTDDTNVTLTLGGTPTTALLRASSLTLGWTGRLGLARGGTNADLSATGGTGQVLQQSSAGAAITVGTISGTSVTGAALTKTDDTNVTLTLGGAPTTALLNAASLTLSWTGTLSVTRGGTAANLSATGGTSQVLRQSSAGAAVTVSQLASTDISDVTQSNTFTPAITLGGAAVGVTYTSQQGRYMQIGKHVFYTICIQVSSKGSSTGTLLVTTGTLPACVNVSNQYQTCAGFWNNLAAGFTSTPQTYIAPNSNVFNPCKLTAGAIVALVDTDIANSTVIILNGHYETN